MKDDKLYFEHILECIGRIEQYVGNNHHTFMESTLIQDAVLRNLQILAESTQRISDNLKEQHAEIPWRNISGFRNILVHDYLGGVNLNQVWEIVVKELPALKKQIQTILSTVHVL